MFDYLIYRFYSAFEDRYKGTVNSLWLASLALVVLLFLALYSLAFLLYYMSKGTLSINNSQIDKMYFKMFFFVALIGLSFLYYWYYKKKIDKLIVKYKNCKLNKTLKIWMFYLFALFLLTSPVLWKEIYKLL